MAMDELNCKTECMRDTTCLLYTFTKSTSSCSLKKALNTTNAVIVKGTVSGFKNAHDPGIEYSV